MSEVTQLLIAIDEGDHAAADQLLPLVYRELRRLATARMSHEKMGQTIQATALVHEAYLRLVEPSSSQKWKSRGHFFGAAAEAMRRILVERARHKATIRAGRDLQRVELSEDVAVGTDNERLDLVELDAALNKLEETHARRAQVVKLRFFAGLKIGQIAAALDISRSTADADWAYAKCWLRVEMEKRL